MYNTNETHIDKYQSKVFIETVPLRGCYEYVPYTVYGKDLFQLMVEHGHVLTHKTRKFPLNGHYSLHYLVSNVLSTVRSTCT